MWRASAGPLMAAVDDEIVALGLARDRLLDRAIEEFVALRRAQRRAQVGGILLAEAHVERAGAGHAHAVAGFAEIVRERRDEAEPAAGLRHPDITSGAAGLVVDVLEREALGEPRARDRERQVLVEPAFADIAERHHLDQRELHAAPVRPAHELGEFVLVDALERHRVDLDLETRGLGGVDAGQHLVELAPARHRAELVGVERVERHIDALDAQARELGGVFREAASRWW